MTGQPAFIAESEGHPRRSGRTDFDLINARGWRVGSVDVTLRATTLTLDYRTRRLALMDRDRFREWLIHPRDVLEVDDVTWFVQTGLTCITIDGRSSYVIPGSCIGHLVSVV